MNKIIYFSNVDKHGKYTEVTRDYFLDPLKVRGVNTSKLSEIFKRLDYSGNPQLTPEEYETALSTLPDPIKDTIEGLVFHNNEKGFVSLRGREYHLHITSGSEKQQEIIRLEYMRERILANISSLSGLEISLAKEPQYLSSQEKLTIATLLDHQKQYAISLFVASHNFFMQNQRRGIFAPLSDFDNKALDDCADFCKSAIDNYYKFIVHDNTPEVACPPQSITDVFSRITLPSTTVMGKSDGPRKLSFRDLDHPGQIILYASNLLEREETIDSAIVPLYGAIEIPFAVNAIISPYSRRINKTHFVRFSRHGEGDRPKIIDEPLSQFVLRAHQDSLVKSLQEDGRVVLLDDGISTGLTLRVLKEYFEEKYQRIVEIGAVEQDLQRRYVPMDPIPANIKTSGKKIRVIPFEALDIPAIAIRKIKCIESVIKSSIGLGEKED